MCCELAHGERLFIKCELFWGMKRDNFVLFQSADCKACSIKLAESSGCFQCRKRGEAKYPPPPPPPPLKRLFAAVPGLCVLINSCFFCNRVRCRYFTGSLLNCSENESRVGGKDRNFLLCTANEGPVRIQYKCPVPVYVFPEMKLLVLKYNYNVLSPSSYTHISVRDLYISRIGLPILLQGNMWTDPGNI